ncbi:putative phospholipase D [Helianthus annuus]|nr:putative phospholipase D [Helianthus annuus]
MATSDQFIRDGGTGPRYMQMQPEPSFFSLQNPPEASRIFDELPKATIVQVSRHDPSDIISPVLLTYTIDFQYKQVLLLLLLLFYILC